MPADPSQSASDQPKAQRSAQTPGGDARQLPNQMHTLTNVIKDLEDQLDRMMATNEALKVDLDGEREKRVGLETKLDDLRERLRRSEQEVAGQENLAAEASHLNQERARLSASLRDSQQKLEELERDHRKDSGLINRLRAARADALEEVESVEAQFGRAMQLVAEVRAQLMVVNEERNALTGRLKVLEDSLHETQRERDALRQEVEESRAALDDISRSLNEAYTDSGTDLKNDQSRRRPNADAAGSGAKRRGA